jgi:serine/threonine-protein kinase HipA
MRKANILIHGIKAASLLELDKNLYEVIYEETYQGQPISLTLPLKNRTFSFKGFPPFFEGLLPEGAMLESLLRTRKIDRDDLFSQLIAVGLDLVGSVTVESVE